MKIHYTKKHTRIAGETAFCSQAETKTKKKQGRLRVKRGGASGHLTASGQKTNKTKQGLGSGELGFRATSLDQKPSKRKTKQSKRQKQKTIKKERAPPHPKPSKPKQKKKTNQLGEND